MAQVRAKYSRRKSATEALTLEILTGSDLADRRRAALLLVLLRGRPRLGRLKRLIAELVVKVEATNDEWLGPPERNLLCNLLLAFGFMDTKRSHAVLARLACESASHLVRADALEAMAFEKRFFDLDLVLPFLHETTSTPELLSALYAIQYTGYAKNRPDDARERLRPLLNHPYGHVRAYTVDILGNDPSNFSLIETLQDDPHMLVREWVADALR